MISSEHKVVAGVFELRASAEQAIEGLKEAGFRDDQIGYVVRDHMRPQEVSQGGLAGLGSANGAGAGAVTGGVIGGLLSVMVALLIPGLGPIFAGGILATTLSGMALGAVSGGFLGALMGVGMPEEDARYYESEFGAGRTIVLVKTQSRQREALEILRSYGAYDVLSQSIAVNGREGNMWDVSQGRQQSQRGAQDAITERRLAINNSYERMSQRDRSA